MGDKPVLTKETFAKGTNLVIGCSGFMPLVVLLPFYFVFFMMLFASSRDEDVTKKILFLLVLGGVLTIITIVTIVTVFRKIRKVKSLNAAIQEGRFFIKVLSVSACFLEKKWSRVGDSSHTHTYTRIVFTNGAQFLSGSPVSHPPGTEFYGFYVDGFDELVTAYLCSEWDLSDELRLKLRR